MEQKTTEAIVNRGEEHYRIRLRLDNTARGLKIFGFLREIQLFSMKELVGTDAEGYTPTTDLFKL